MKGGRVCQRSIGIFAVKAVNGAEKRQWIAGNWKLLSLFHIVDRYISGQNKEYQTSPFYISSINMGYFTRKL